MKTRFGRPFLEGWEEIAEALGKHPSTVRVYAGLEKDPLPVQRDLLSKRVWIWLSELKAWAKMQGLGDVRDPAEIG